jgi:DMSO/TMAO reductase YedYZ molybdopterin-dependent catalytic subunit
VANKARRNKSIVGIVLLVGVALSFVASSGLFPSPSFASNRQAQLNEPKSQNWTLVIDGLVDSPLNLSASNLLAMPFTLVNAELYCVGGGTVNAVEKGTWEGVTLKSILEEVGAHRDVVKVAFYAPDGFSTDLTIQDAQRGDIIVSYKKDGEFLRDRDGNLDLRLVVPGKWGYKWIRSLNHVKLVDYDFKGFYESTGYSDEANIEP